jgi:hypothetical protein
VDALNVAQFLAAYNASFANVLELKTSTVTGILESRSDRIYNGKVYWDLVDGNARLRVLTPVRYRHLKERWVEVIGQPKRRINKDHGEIQVILDVEHMTPLDPTPDDWMGPLRLIGQQRQSSWPGIERALENRIAAGDQPRVPMFHGVGAITDKDVEGELRAYPSAYALDKREIPLSDPAAVAAALSGGNLDADLVAVVRGGSDMRALSDRQVVEAVAYHMPIPIVSAVGHDVVQPLIQDVVHWAFATPTAFGTWLADRAKGAIRAREAMALDHTRALEAMQRQLTELSEVATAAKLAETAAREAATQLAETAAQKAAAQAREETGRLRQELQESESRRQTMRYMTAAMGAVLLVVLVILVFILAM